LRRSNLPLDAESDRLSEGLATLFRDEFEYDVDTIRAAIARHSMFNLIRSSSSCQKSAASSAS
jgi:hypothetical protein